MNIGCGSNEFLDHGPCNSPLPAHIPPPLVQFPCAGMSCLTCNTFAIWAATSARTAASTRKSAGDLQQRVQQCSGPQSSGAAGTSPVAPKRAYMAAWCFRFCYMEQSPGTSRPPSCSGLRFSIVGAFAAFWGLRRRDGISIEELLRRTQLCNIGTTIRRLHLRWLGHVMRMPGERVARQVLFGQLRGTRPVGSPPVTLRGLMRKDVPLMNSGGGQVHGRRWYQECMEKAAWRVIRCYEVFRSLHGLEIHWNGSQGSP
jgi:hypothetical protein